MRFLLRVVSKCTVGLGIGDFMLIYMFGETFASDFENLDSLIHEVGDVS